MSEKKYCLQCGAELSLVAVPSDPNYPHGNCVPACSACYSRAYSVPGNKILELTAQRDELLAVVKDMMSADLDMGNMVKAVENGLAVLKKYDHA